MDERDLILNKEAILRLLADAAFDIREYWVTSGAAMVLYGIRDVTRDIDLGCTSRMADQLEREGCPVEVLRDGSRKIVFSEAIELFENWIEDKVVLFEGIPVVSIDGMITMKEKLGREKDRKDILLINEFRNSGERRFHGQAPARSGQPAKDPAGPAPVPSGLRLQALYEQWQAEEDCAHIRGWDFSHIRGRYEEEHDLPWDYGAAVRDYLRPDLRLLDLDTGGGEFLLSLGHPYRLTAATENYPPNAALCRETLCPLGIDFRQADAAGPLPFADGSFDIIIDRHGNYCVPELARLLRPGGVFVTEQVGERNDRELVELLLPGASLPFPGHDLARRAAELEEAGFTLLRREEAFRPILFYDVGALVWFARIIEWEFPGFSVAGCLDRLRAAQELLERDGKLEGSIHRFLLAAKKRG